MLRFSMLRFSPMSCLLTAIAGLSFFPSIALSQSFLDKLEQAVRQQLGEESPETTSGELPSPKNPANPVPPPVIASQSSQSGLPAGGQVSEVPLPAVANQSGGPEQNGDSVENNRNGQIYLGLEVEEPVGGGIGVRVTSVTKQSPAWKAGFEVGDRILAVNGFAIANINSMIEQLGKMSPGQSVDFVVLRNGRNSTRTAVLMDAGLVSRLPGFAGKVQSPADSDAPAWLGLKVNDLTNSFRNQFAISVFRGAAVTQVVNGSPAHKAGIRPGDVVIEANGAPMEGAQDLMAWVSRTRPGERVQMIVYRGSTARQVELTLEVDPSIRESSSRTSNRIPSSVAVPPPPLGPSSRLELESQSADATPSLVLPSTPDGDSPENSIPENRDSANAHDEGPLTTENQRLREENQRLKNELESARKRLEITEQRLNQILEGLKGQNGN